MSQVVNEGFYAGIYYLVVEKDGKLFVSPDSEIIGTLMAKGANMHLLDDIGKQDPDDVMAAWIDSIPK